MIKLELLEDLYVDRLYKLRDAEAQLARVLLKFAQNAESDELAKCFEIHFGTTQTHLDRLEAILGRYSDPLTPRTSKGMRGILAEAKILIAGAVDRGLRDELLVATGETIAHYEIAGYSIALTFARALHFHSDAELLRRTLADERSVERELARFAQALAAEAVDDQDKAVSE